MTLLDKHGLSVSSQAQIIKTNSRIGHLRVYVSTGVCLWFWRTLRVVYTPQMFSERHSRGEMASV